METQNFEDKLFKMTIPDVKELKHQDLLAETILKEKDKSLLSWWWISIPLFIIVMFIMKSFFMPQTTLISGIDEFKSNEKYISILFFLVLPISFIIINFLSIRKIYFLAGNPVIVRFIKKVWFNIMIIIVSVMILIIYFL